jgi:hypothetical protein
VSTVQDFTDMPSISTVQAPQCEVRSRCAGRCAAAFAQAVDEELARLDQHVDRHR